MNFVEKFVADVVPPSGLVAIGHGYQDPAGGTTFVDPAQVAGIVGAHAANTDTTTDFYFTFNTFKGNSRLSAMAYASKSLVLDVDLNHPKKPSYRTKEDAAAALAHMCARTGLPLPSYVIDSGRGLHCYWALDYHVTPESWKDMAEGFKRFVLTHDPALACDPSRLADLSGYLRLPGSINTKNNGRCWFYMPGGVHPGTGQCYDPGRLFQLVGAVARSTAPATYAQGGPGAFGPGPRVNPFTQQDTPENDTRVDDFQTVVSLCPAAQRHMALRDDPAMGYNERLPMIKLISLIRDDNYASQVAHWLYQNHPSYNVDSMDKRLRTLDRDRPVTCGALSSACDPSRSVCAGCPLYKSDGGNSPIMLERANGKAKAMAAQAGAQEPAAPIDDTHSDRVHEALSAPVLASELGVDIPPYLEAERVGCYATTNGHMMLGIEYEEENTGQVKRFSVQLAGRFIWLTRRLTAPDPQDGFVLEGYIAHGSGPQRKAQRFLLPEGDLASATLLVTFFASRAVHIDAKSRSQLEAFAAYIREQATALSLDMLVHATSRFGFKETPEGRVFVLADREIMHGRGERLVPLMGDASEMRGKYKLRGDEAEARALLGVYGKAGSDLTQTLIASSFGATLMHMTGVAGLMVNMFGHSGFGKSAVQGFMSSVWGYGEPDCITPTDTALSRLNKLGALHHMPAMFDEITTLDGMDLGQLAYTMTQGRGNDGRRSDGTLRGLAPEWQTILFSSANRPLHNVLTTTGQMTDAQRYRILDVHCTGASVTLTRAQMTTLAEATKRNTGQLGRLFVRWVLEHYDWVKQTVIDEFNAQATNNAERNWAAFGAVTVVANTILNHMGLWRVADMSVRAIVNKLRGENATSVAQQKLNVRRVLATYIHESGGNYVGIAMKTPSTGVAAVGSLQGQQNDDVLNRTTRAPALYRVVIPPGGQGRVALCIVYDALKAWCGKKNIDVHDLLVEMAEQKYTHGASPQNCVEPIQIYQGVLSPTGAEYATSLGGVAPVDCVVIGMRTKDGTPCVHDGALALNKMVGAMP